MNLQTKIAFSTALIGISVGCFAVATNPAQGYELSITGATPTIFWLGIGATIGVSLIGAVAFERKQNRVGAAVLGLIAILLVALLPFLRGYYFHGLADSLQHLGWTKDIVLADSLTDGNPYPGIHAVTQIFAEVLGIPVRRALMLIVPLFFGLYAISIPVLTRHFLPNQDYKPGSTVAFGIAVAVLTPPILAVRLPNFQPIATNAGLFILPFAVYLAVQMPERAHRRHYYSLLVITLASITVYHPQHGLVMIALLFIYATAEILIPWQDRVPSTTVLSATLLTSVVLGWWLATRQVFAGALAAVIRMLQSTGGGVSAASPGSAFEEIGGSVLVLLARSLLIQLIIGVLVALVGLVSVARVLRYRRDDERETAPIQEGRIVRYLLGFTPLLGLLALYVAAGDLPQAVRYAGVMVALGVPVVAAKMAEFERPSSRSVRAIFAVVLVIGAGIAVPAMFRSPHVYSPTPHVTETQMEAYDWTFEGSDGSPVVSVNTDVERQLMALEGYREGNRRWWNGEFNSDIENSRGTGFVPSHFGNQSLRSLSDAPSWHLVSTEYGYKRNVNLYDGLRFDDNDYEYLETTQGINRVYSNGGGTVYVIQSTDTTAS